MKTLIRYSSELQVTETQNLCGIKYASYAVPIGRDEHGREKYTTVSVLRGEGPCEVIYGYEPFRTGDVFARDHLSPCGWRLLGRGQGAPQGRSYPYVAGR